MNVEFINPFVKAFIKASNATFKTMLNLDLKMGKPVLKKKHHINTTFQG